MPIARSRLGVLGFLGRRRDRIEAVEGEEDDRRRGHHADLAAPAVRAWRKPYGMKGWKWAALKTGSATMTNSASASILITTRMELTVGALAQCRRPADRRRPQMMKIAGKLTMPPSSAPGSARREVQPMDFSKPRGIARPADRDRADDQRIFEDQRDQPTSRRSVRRTRHRCRCRRCPTRGSSSPPRHKQARRRRRSRRRWRSYSITAGPALPAPTPIRVRMPVPTIAPTPSATRCGQDSVCFSRCSSGMSSRATTALRYFQFHAVPRHPGLDPEPAFLS